MNIVVARVNYSIWVTVFVLGKPEPIIFFAGAFGLTIWAQPYFLFDPCN